MLKTAPNMAPPRAREMLLAAVAVLLSSATATIIGLNVDIEDFDNAPLYLATVRNATAMTHASGLPLTKTSRSTSRS